MPDQVAVTGAGGSLGQALLDRLIARGLTVKALVRNQQDARVIDQRGGVPVLGDVREPATLAPLVKGCRVVFHLAAWMPGAGGRRVAEAVNIAGTASIVRLAAEAGCRRVVHASSIAVYGPKPARVVTEATPAQAVGDPYGDTKIAGEHIAVETARRCGVELTILRPTMIYGPGSPSWTLAPLTAISRGLPVVLGNGEGLLNVVYLDDVARAFELAGFNPAAAGEVFIIGNEPVSCNVFMGHYARMAGMPLHRLPVPLARLGLWLAAQSSRIVSGSALTTPEMTGVMTSRAQFSSDKARTVLGYRPEVGLAEGMRRTQVWLRQAGKLPRASTALVTGANGGLGQAVVNELTARGLEVWAADLTESKSAWRDRHTHAIAMDVTSDKSVTDAVRTIENEAGAIDVLINIAGVLKAAPLESQPLSDLSLLMEVNALGPLRVARAVAPAMRRRRRGRIVNIGSTNSFSVTPFLGGYAASKHALKAFSETLQMELGLWGVEVVMVHPAAMSTSLADGAKHRLRQELAAMDGDWRELLETFLTSWLWGTGSAQSPQQAAQVVVRAALAGRAAGAEVFTSRDAFIVRIFSLLPSSFRHGLLMRGFGLRRDVP